MFLEILKSPDKDFECTKLRSILKMLIVGIFLDINKYQKMWKHMVNWIKQILEAIHICISIYIIQLVLGNPVKQIKFTVLFKMLLQRGYLVYQSLVCGNTIIRESNSIWGTHENKQKEFLIDY